MSRIFTSFLTYFLLFLIIFVLAINVEPSYSEESDYISKPAKSAPATGPAIIMPLLKVLVLVFAFSALILGSLYAVYRRRMGVTAGGPIRTIANSMIMPGVTIQVLDIGGILYVIAVTKNGVQTLGQIDERDKVSEVRTRIAELIEADRPFASLPPPEMFQQTLSKFFSNLSNFRKGMPGQEVKDKSRDKLLHDQLARLKKLASKKQPH